MNKISLNLFLFFIIISGHMQSQDQLPFKSIPQYPDNYKSGNIIQRMIHGLGYRYYWATEGLTDKDLKYRPSNKAMSSLETLEHIYGLAETINKTSLKKVNYRPYRDAPENFESIRRETLNHLQLAANRFSDLSYDEISDNEIIFETNDIKTVFPLWNLINGQISDAIYHTGQIVSFRRTTGNPMKKGVNVFIGKTK